MQKSLLVLCVFSVGVLFGAVIDHQGTVHAQQTVPAGCETVVREANEVIHDQAGRIKELEASQADLQQYAQGAIADKANMVSRLQQAQHEAQTTGTVIFEPKSLSVPIIHGWGTLALSPGPKVQQLESLAGITPGMQLQPVMFVYGKLGNVQTRFPGVFFAWVDLHDGSFIGGPWPAEQKDTIEQVTDSN